MDPKTLRYSKTHEWASLEGGICTVGLSQFAVDQLTDITFIELPKVGTKVTAEKAFGVIESVKSANDLYAPVSGEVVEINAAVAKEPPLVSEDCYGKGWLIRIRVGAGTTLDRLQTPEQYEQQIASEGH
jgi:glycine cleavage system H protein